MRTIHFLLSLIVLIAGVHLTIVPIPINSGKTLDGIVVEELPCESTRPCQGCGDGVCNYPAENCVTCPNDCGVCAACQTSCGNGICEVDETSCNCPSDCGLCCLDGVCESQLGETYLNCAQDCTVSFNLTTVDSSTFNILPGTTVQCSSPIFPFGPLVSDSGIFTFTNIPPGSYVCSASKYSYVGNQVSIYITPSMKNVSSTVALTLETSVIEGTVTDQSTGLPLVGSQVYCTSGTYTTPTVLTDSEGDFVYVGLSTGSWSCWASYPAYSTLSLNGTLLSGQHLQFEMVLRSLPSVVYGYVVEQYTLAPVLAPSATCVQGSVVRSLVGNDQGVFALVNPSPGPISCTVSKGGYISATANGTVPPGVAIILNFTLGELPSALAGAVYDAYTQLPIQNATIYCTQPKQAPISTTSLPGGNFTMPAVVGVWTCVASINGWSNRTSVIQVFAGTTEFLPFVLQPLPATVSGTVVDTNSDAVFGATVFCQFTLLPNTQPNLGPVQSNSTGQFSFQNILFNTSAITIYFSCIATQNGFGAGTQTGSLTRGGSSSFAITLIELGLQVTVVDANSNAAIPGASVTCSGPTTASGTSDGLGIVLLNGLPVGTYNCSASLVSYTGSYTMVTIAPNSGLVDATVAIQITTYVVRGTIQNSAGVAIPTATLTVFDSTGTFPVATPPVGVNGSWYTFLVLPATYQFFAQNGPNFLTATSTQSLTPATASGLNLVLNLAALSSTISGIVKDNSTGLPIANVLLYLFASTSSGNTFLTSQVSGPDGSYSFTKQNQGTFVIQASFDLYITSNVAFSVPSLGIIVTVPVAIQPNIYGSVTGLVVSSYQGNVAPLPGANVSIVYAAGTSIITVSNLTGSDGSFTFNNIIAGTATLYAALTGYTSVTQTVVIYVATVTTASNLALSPLTGQVFGSLYILTPLGARESCSCYATVQLFAAGTTATPANVLSTVNLIPSNPSYTFPSVPQGSYYVVATNANNNKVVTSNTFTVTHTAPTQIDLLVA